MKTNAYSGKVSFPAGDDQPTVQKAIKKPELVKMEKKSMTSIKKHIKK